VIATVDLRDPDPAAVDAGLQEAGFLLVTGHGVDAALRAELRAAARRFFALPASVKRAYAVGVGGRGWLPPGVEANGAVEGPDPDGGEHPPDLKESFAIGPDTPTGTRPSTRCGSRRTSGPPRCPSCRPSPRGTWRR
jgi:isopenicillin N synthase-like dioxygenase